METKSQTRMIESIIQALRDLRPSVGIEVTTRESLATGAVMLQIRSADDARWFDMFSLTIIVGKRGGVSINPEYLTEQDKQLAICCGLLK